MTFGMQLVHLKNATDDAAHTKVLIIPRCVNVVVHGR